jgi:Golgi phosphoprotein 3 (GPP34)
MNGTETNLSEALVLLALDDERGTVGMNASGTLGYGLAGAALLELLFQGRVTIEAKNVVIADGTPTGDDILDDALSEVAASRRPRSAQHWVGHLQGRIPHHRDRLIARLVARGILQHEEDHILGIIPRQRYPQADGSAEADLRTRLRAVALEGAAPDGFTAPLLRLIQACRLDGTLFTREERKRAKERIKEISRGDVMGKAVADAIASVEAGITAAVIAATTVSTMSSSTS